MINTVNIYKALVIILRASHTHFHLFTIPKLYGVDVLCLSHYQNRDIEMTCLKLHS